MKKPRSKRSPVSRAEGESRFIRATLELARERPFGELSAREIARRADMNHGYVHVWFGSKAGLLDAACHYQAQNLRSQVLEGQLTIDAVGAPEIQVLFRLLGRLQAEPGGIELARQRERPMAELVTDTLTATSNIDRATARSLTEFAVAAAAGVSLVGEVLDLDVPALVNVWRAIVASLATTTPD